MNTELEKKFLDAARKGDTATVQECLDQGVAVDVIEDHDYPYFSALMLAAAMGHPGTVKLLLDRGATVDLRGSAGATALFLAARYGVPDVAKLLVEKEADPNVTIENHKTALQAAAAMLDLKTMKLLLEHGAKINVIGVGGKTVLDLAIQWKVDEVARFLRERGAKCAPQFKKSATMNPKVMTMEEIFSRTGQWIVSTSQSGYDSTEKQWDRQWTIIGELAKNDSPRPYFLGCILTQPINAALKNVDKMLLLDGQQRLMTVFIQIALLRDLEKANEHTEIAAEIHDTLLVNRYATSEDDFLKIAPAKRDQKSYEHLIKGGERIADSRIFAVYKYFEAKFKNTTIPLAKIKQIILNFYVVNIILDENDDVYQILETLDPVKKHFPKI